MKHFAITLGRQSLSFSEADLPALEAALAGAVRSPDQEVIRQGKSGQVSVLMSTTGALHKGLPGQLHFSAAHSSEIETEY